MKLGLNLLLWTTHVTDEHRADHRAPQGGGLGRRRGSDVRRNARSLRRVRSPARRYRSRRPPASASCPAAANPPSPPIWPSAPAPSATCNGSPIAPPRSAAPSPPACSTSRSASSPAAAPPLTRSPGSATSTKQAAQYAAKQGGALSVEPLNRFECYFFNSAAQAAELGQGSRRANYGYLYDTFHFNIEENSITSVIPATINQINHVHIPENNRGVPGAGHIDFPVGVQRSEAGRFHERLDDHRSLRLRAAGSSPPPPRSGVRCPVLEAEVYEKGFKLMREGWGPGALIA